MHKHTLVQVQCSLTEYIGKQELQLNTSDPENTTSVAVSSSLDQASGEREALWVLQRLNSLNASQECTRVLKPWICKTLFVYCDEACATTTDMTYEVDYQSACPNNVLHHIVSNSTYLKNCTIMSGSGIVSSKQVIFFL